jgi:acyl-CoA thioester hydrolase
MELDALLDGFPVVITLPVSWGDMDAFQHVNNTRFFRYFEDARIAYFERTGLVDFASSPTGVGPVVAQTACRYRAPLRYPDELQVGARVTSVGQHSFRMEYRVVSVALHAIAATGSAVIVAFDFAEERKAVLPEAWRRALSHVENCDLPVHGDAPGDDELGS